jgi:hypothetical protein
VDSYRWLTQPWPTGLGEAGCVTVVLGADGGKVLDAFAAQPDERVPLPDGRRFRRRMLPLPSPTARW